MKQVLVVGGGGMVGQKLASRLATDGLDGSRNNRVVLVDIGFPENGAPADETIQGDFADAELSRAPGGAAFGPDLPSRRNRVR